MKYVALGNTGIKVSPVGLGCMRFPDNLKGASQVIHAAYENGVNLFDTAPDYVNSNSEIYVGKALKEIRNKVIISTKKTVRSAPTSKDAFNAVLAALKRIGTEYIDIFYLWCILSINDFYKAREKGGFLEGLEKAKNRGLIRHIGVSVHVDAKSIQELVTDYPFEVILMGYNILNSNLREGGAKFAKQKGLGVLAMNPVGGGVLGYKDSAKLNFLKWRDLSGPAAALKWVISNPSFDVALNGAESSEMIKDSLTAVDAPDMTPEDRINLQSYTKNISADFCTGCSYCLPCPEGVEIPEYLNLLNRYNLGGFDAFKNEYYEVRKLGFISDSNSPDLCTQCEECIDKCTAKLDIPDFLEKVRSLIKKI